MVPGYGLVTVREYESWLVGAASQAIQAAVRAGGSFGAVCEAALSMPDACAFEIEVSESRVDGRIGVATEKRLYDLARAEWLAFLEWAANHTGQPVGQLLASRELPVNGFWGAGEAGPAGALSGDDRPGC